MWLSLHCMPLSVLALRLMMQFTCRWYSKQRHGCIAPEILAEKPVQVSPVWLSSQSSRNYSLVSSDPEIHLYTLRRVEQKTICTKLKLQHCTNSSCGASDSPSLFPFLIQAFFPPATLCLVIMEEFLSSQTQHQFVRCVIHIVKKERYVWMVLLLDLYKLGKKRQKNLKH